MITLTRNDLAKIKVFCIKSNDIPLLDKILEIEDYCIFFTLDGITLDIDWRKDREEENNI